MAGLGRLVRPYRGRKRAVAAAAAVIAALWTIGLIDFVGRIPDRVADREATTDAIVVLTGGSKRLEEGLRLLADGRAQRMFVSGVYPDVETPDLLALASADAERFVCCVDVGHGAENTAGNAAETAAWMRRNGYRSLRLVTSSYHMPRSLLEFRATLPEMTVVPHAVFPDAVRTERWWQRPATAALIASEYVKYLLSLGRHAVLAPMTGG